MKKSDGMNNWLTPVKYTFAGFCFLNLFPHIYYGITGISEYTPVSVLQDQTSNLIWGTANLGISGWLVYSGRNAPISFRSKAIYFSTGVGIRVSSYLLRTFFGETASYTFLALAIPAVFVYWYLKFKKQ